jgi:hypothetical protein
LRRACSCEHALLANSSSGWTLIRKTSLSSDRSDGNCGQALADIATARPRRVVVCTTHGSITFDARSSAIVRDFCVLKTQASLKDWSRATLGAILPFHDVRYHATALGCGASRRLRNCFSTDELKIPRSTREWWSQTGSNRRPPACKAGALPTELWPRRAQRVLNHKREDGGPGKT